MYSNRAYPRIELTEPTSSIQHHHKCLLSLWLPTEGWPRISRRFVDKPTSGQSSHDVVNSGTSQCTKIFCKKFGV